VQDKQNYFNVGGRKHFEINMPGHVMLPDCISRKYSNMLGKSVFFFLLNNCECIACQLFPHVVGEFLQPLER